MFQMRMHLYEFEILPPAFGGGQNDISRQAPRTVDSNEILRFGSCRLDESSNYKETLRFK